jgi:hypothetical protein
MAAAATPVAMFLGFALVLGWLGQDLFELPGVPLLLAVVAAVYGIVCGVFLDSPRRWRWDQRQKLRPGTTVPRLSPATRTLAAAVPRSLPIRSRSTVTTSELAARIGHAPAVVHEPVAGVATPQAEADTDSGSVGGAVGTSGVAPAGSSDDVDGVTTVAPEADGLAEAPGVEATPGAGAPRAVTGLTARPRPGDAGSATVAGLQRETDADGAIVLPTSVEPRATRSPWAWAAPPEWNRDEDDEAAGSGSSKRA